MRNSSLTISVLHLFIILISLLLIAFNSSAATCMIDVYARKKVIGLYSRSLAVDTDNQPHIAYGGDHLYHAFCDGISWNYETVDLSESVGYTSIAIDTSDNVHISYYDSTNDDLKYATNASGSWVTETVDSERNLGWYTSIALDTSGKVHISYHDWSNQELKYATNASGSWVTETVNSKYVGTSIVSYLSGKVHISYHDWSNHDLKHTTNAYGPWVTETVDSSGEKGEYASIALDSLGNVHIRYYDNTIDTTLYVPVPDIKANGTDVSITLGTSDTISINTRLAAMSGLGVECDWWLVVNTPTGEWAYYDLIQGTFISGFMVTYQGALFNLGSTEIFNTSGLGAGTYTYYFGVDLNKNGTLDTGTGLFFYDSVEVTVKTAPSPQIYANGSEGSVNISTGEQLSMAVSLTSGGYSGTDADWWVVADTPLGWQYYNLTSGAFTSGLLVTYQGALFNLDSFEIFNTSGLGAGTYTYYFGVDLNKNGTLDTGAGQLYSDSVVVNVTP